ncbi:MAG: hypothetical protein R3E96_01965 [Planctomycetota bacterium]
MDRRRMDQLLASPRTSGTRPCSGSWWHWPPGTTVVPVEKLDDERGFGFDFIQLGTDRE